MISHNIRSTTSRCISLMLALMTGLLCLLGRDNFALADRCHLGYYHPTRIRFKPNYETGEKQLQIWSPELQKNAAGEMYTLNGTVEDSWKDFEIRGMGYSPTPIGKAADEIPFGDYYTLNYEWLWKQDIENMKKAGVNFVRIWSWDMAKFVEHISFLNALYDAGIYTIIPFNMAVPDDTGVGVTYEYLDNRDTVRSVLIDFEFMSRTVLRHPAVLGMFIGNELEHTRYNDQLPDLYGIINSLVAIVREIDSDMEGCYLEKTGEGENLCHHVVSTPITITMFNPLMSKYYVTSNMDFWSIQPYMNNIAFEQLIQAYATLIEPFRNTSSWKNLLISERGRSSMTYDWVNETDGAGRRVYRAKEARVDDEAQLEYLSESWKIVKQNKPVTMGMVIMEWNDEWWKGFVPDSANPNCPDLENDKHEPCGDKDAEKEALAEITVYEEYLGMYEQETVGGDSLIDLSQSFILTPKPGATEFFGLWCEQCKDTDCPDCDNTTLASYTREHTGIQAYPFFVVVFPTMVLVLGTFCCYGLEKRKTRKKIEKLEGAILEYDLSSNSDLEPLDKYEKRVLQEAVRSTLTSGFCNLTSIPYKVHAQLVQFHDTLEAEVSGTKGDEDEPESENLPVEYLIRNIALLLVLKDEQKQSSEDKVQAFKRIKRRKTATLGTILTSLQDIEADRNKEYADEEEKEKMQMSYTRMAISKRHFPKENSVLRGEYDPDDPNRPRMPDPPYAELFCHCYFNVCRLISLARQLKKSVALAPDEELDIREWFLYKTKPMWSKHFRAHSTQGACIPGEEPMEPDDREVVLNEQLAEEVDVAVETFYNRYLAGYMEWIEGVQRFHGSSASELLGEEPVFPEETDGRIDDIVLYVIMRSYIGSLGHAIEFQQRMYHILRTNSLKDGEDSVLPELLEQIRYGYRHMGEAIYSLEDFNGIGTREQQEGENLSSVPNIRDDFKKTFNEAGGMHILAINYNWFLRYVLWVWVFSFYAQPMNPHNMVCASEAVAALSTIDCFLCFFTAALELWLFRPTKYHHQKQNTNITAYFVYHLVWLLICLPAAAGVVEVKVPMIIAGSYNEFTVGHFYIVFAVLIVYGKEFTRWLAGGGVGEHKMTGHGVKEQIRHGKKKKVGIAYMLINLVSLLVFTLYTMTGEGEDLSANNLDFFFPFVGAFLFNFLFHALIQTLAWYTKKKSPEGECSETLRHACRGQFGFASMFWVGVHMSFIVTMATWLVPSVYNVTDTALCPQRPTVLERWGCSMAVFFTWAAAIFVSIALFWLIFELWKMFTSVAVAKFHRIGKVQQVGDLGKVGPSALLHTFSCLSKFNNMAPEAGRLMWTEFIDNLFKDHLLMPSEKEALNKWMADGTKLVPIDPRPPEKTEEEKEAEEAEKKAKEEAGEPTEPTDEEIEMKLLKIIKTEPEMPFVRNPEASRRIVTLATTLASIRERTGGSRTKLIDETVKCMPSFCITVPYYSEAIMYDLPDVGPRPDLHYTPTDMEYLTTQYPDEWDNLAQWLHDNDLWKGGKRNRYKDELLDHFFYLCHLNSHAKSLKKDLPEKAAKCIDIICRFCSFRGQTLGRTIRGLQNVRNGVELVAMLEDVGDIEDRKRRARDLVRERFQIVIAAQIFANKNQDTMRAKIFALQKEFDFDVTYDQPVGYKWGQEEPINVNCIHAPGCRETYSVNLAIYPEIDPEDERWQPKDEELQKKNEKGEVIGELDEEEVKELKKRKLPPRFPQRHFSFGRHKIAGVEHPLGPQFHTTVTERPGPLRVSGPYPTEGKAENQYHSIPFVRAEVMFALDMNQDAPIEEGYKMPSFLSHYFGGFEPPRYQCVGFTEHCYTRCLSLVGEMMGAAEFSFVTIVQRVLAQPLHIRMHYGHPDAFDCHYFRSHGGMSKASFRVNMNEDIFCGYELLMRGRQVAFSEWISFSKGRESSFIPAMTFLMKLNGGAGQQCRSRDIYFLNQNLDWSTRMALICGSLGFYFASVILCASVFFYLWSIVLFTVSGVTFHEIGVIGGKLAVAWIFQLGYIMALPLFIENTLQYGVVEGIKRFIQTVIYSAFFYTFALQISYYFFCESIQRCKATYLGTGRGFDIQRKTIFTIFKLYGLSHYPMALLYLILLTVFRLTTKEDNQGFLIRTFTVIIVITSWYGAPIFFHAYPSRNMMSEGVTDLFHWLTGTPAAIEKVEADAVHNKSYLAWHMAAQVNYYKDEEAAFHPLLIVFVETFNIFMKCMPPFLCLAIRFRIEMVYLVMLVIFVALGLYGGRQWFFIGRATHKQTVFELCIVFSSLCSLILYFVYFDIDWVAGILSTLLVLLVIRVMLLFRNTFRRFRYIRKYREMIAKEMPGKRKPEEMPIWEERVRCALVVAYIDMPVMIISAIILYIFNWLMIYRREFITAANYNDEAVVLWTNYENRSFEGKDRALNELAHDTLNPKVDDNGNIKSKAPPGASGAGSLGGDTTVNMAPSEKAQQEAKAAAQITNNYTIINQGGGQDGKDGKDGVCPCGCPGCGCRAGGGAGVQLNVDQLEEMKTYLETLVAKMPGVKGGVVINPGAPLPDGEHLMEASANGVGDASQPVVYLQAAQGVKSALKQGTFLNDKLREKDPLKKVTRSIFKIKGAGTGNEEKVLHSEGSRIETMDGAKVDPKKVSFGVHDDKESRPSDPNRQSVAFAKPGDILSESQVARRKRSPEVSSRRVTKEQIDKLEASGNAPEPVTYEDIESLEYYRAKLIALYKAADVRPPLFATMDKELAKHKGKEEELLKEREAALKSGDLCGGTRPPGWKDPNAS